MDTSPETKPNRSGNFLLWPFVGLAVYVLSFGPVVKYCMISPGVKTEETLVAFYFPIFWLMEFTPLKTAFNFYLQLWGVSFG